MVGRLLMLVVLAGPVAGVGTGWGQEPDTAAGVELRFQGDATVPAGTREAFLLVVQGTARVEGEVGTLVVINGSAELAGGRVKDLAVARGTASLRDGAVVSGDVHLFDADIQVESGSSVTGQIDRGYTREALHGLGLLAAMLALGLAVATLVAGLVAAGVAPGPVRKAGAALTTTPGATLLAALIVWIGLPVAAALLMGTVVGIPTAVGVFFFVLPVLGFLGFLVSGIRIGDGVMLRVRGRTEPAHPYLAALTGITLLLLAGWVPVLGGFITMIAGMGGAGAVAFVAWQATRAQAPAPE
jgi:hypothetical protein